jgi:serine/threonine-protein kinase
VALRYCLRCRSIFTAQVGHCPIDGAGLVDVERDPLVGHDVDRYRVLERIGMGATGCVYRVRHAVLEHERAMKILYGDLGQDARLLERFKREAKAVAKMRHPNVLSVSDFGRSENGLLFLVMELLRGPTLHDEMACFAPFPPGRAGFIVEQIAAGLGEAHRLGYVHRDVKPTNIVLSDQDGVETIKILDFGIVGLRTEPLSARLTNLGFLVGTPAYMAPEQATAPSEVTPAADLYSLGVITYEMLTGRLPFKATDPLDMIVEHSITPAPKLPPCGGLEALVDWMLQKRPGDRPQSTTEVLEALSQLELDPFEAVDTSPGLGPPELDLPLLDPITYVAREEPIATYESLRGRLDGIREMLLRAPWESNVRTTFEERLSELSVAVRPGLRDFRYQDLSNKIGGLEDELWRRTKFRPA